MEKCDVCKNGEDCVDLDRPVDKCLKLDIDGHIFNVQVI